MEVLLVPIKINICSDLCFLSLWQQGGWLRGYICFFLPKGLKTSEWPAVFIIKFSKGKLFWSNWSNNMRGVISGQFPAVFTLENIFQVFAVLQCSTTLPSLGFRHASASRAITSVSSLSQFRYFRDTVLVNFGVDQMVNAALIFKSPSSDGIKQWNIINLKYTKEVYFTPLFCVCHKE